MRSRRGLALMLRMAAFHTEGSCVVKVCRLGACARAVLSRVVGPKGLCGGGAGGWLEAGYARENEEKTGVDDSTGDVGVSSESLNAMLAVS
jgi:hypothetical protein